MKKRLKYEFRNEERVVPQILDENSKYYEVEKDEDYNKYTQREKKGTVKCREMAKSIYYDDIEREADNRIKNDNRHSYSLDYYDKI